MLAQRHWQEIARGADCLAQPQPNFEPTATLRRMDARVVSVSLFASYDCGGAHPDFGDDPLNVDPRTGQVLAVEDVLWLGRGAPPRRDGPTPSQWFDYRDKQLGPWIAATLARRYPKQVKPADDECDYTDPGVWNFPPWYVTADGVHVGAIFPRVIRMCDDPDWAVLPWRDVDAHAGAVRLH